MSSSSATSVSTVFPSTLVETITNLLSKTTEVPPGLSYGTAGFRTLENKLDSIVLRMGLLAALRAKQQNKVCIIL